MGTPGPQPTWPLPPWVDPGARPEWVSCPSGCPAHARSSALTRVACPWPRASPAPAVDSLRRSQPAARRLAPDSRCGAVTCPWPSSGVSSGRNICLPALQRSPPTSQPLPRLPAPGWARSGEVHSYTRHCPASSACSSTLQLLLLAGQPGRLKPRASGTPALLASASAARPGAPAWPQPASWWAAGATVTRTGVLGCQPPSRNRGTCYMCGPPNPSPY